MSSLLTFRRANNLLLVVIVIINGYVATAPFWPQLAVWWQLHSDHTQATLQQEISRPLPAASAAPYVNRVVIPDMGLSAPIGEGTYGNRYAVLHNGIWRYSRGSTPDRGGNTTLIGHRFTYTNPHGIFYAMDRLKTGSVIAVFWNHHRYIYRVATSRVVSPNDVKIQDNTTNPQLTLFTCTPLWHPTSRLVVVATLESKT